MRGSSPPKPLKAGRIFLILLYALTFYFGPQIGGGSANLHEGALEAHEAGGMATGFYLMNLFNDRFELNDF